MMPKMNQVVLNEKPQRDRLVPANSASHAKRGLRNAADRVRELVVVPNPELKQIEPRAMLIVLHADPRVLLVSRELEEIHLLGPNEPLMVVGRRVNQMPDYLLD